MAIDFRCTQCNKLLRTADDTAGKQAKCPECGAVMTIPEPLASSAGSPPPPSSGGSPFAAAGPRPSYPADSGNPYQSPSPMASMRPSEFRGPIAQGTLDIGDIFNRTWILFKIDWGECLVAALVASLLNAGVGMAAGLVPFVGMIVSMLFSVWINIGLAMYFLKKVRGQEVALGEVFNGWPYFGKVLLAGILVGLIILAVVLVCVLPLGLVGLTVSKAAAITLAILGGIVAMVLGWYVSLVVSQFNYLIIDRNMDPIDALKTSQRLMEGNKLTLFLIWLVSGVAGFFVVVLTCGLGGLVVAPFLAMMQAVIYLTVTGQPTAAEIDTAAGSPFGSLPRMGPVP